MGREVDLFQAVKAGDLMTVQKILCKATSTNSKKANGSVKQSNLNQQDVDGLSVLHHAALAGNYSLMKLLIENGIKVDVKDNKGLRPLHYAAWLGKDKPVELLLHCGSCVNVSAFDGTTPLHLACEHGHYDVVKKLLAHNGDPRLQNNLYKTPLDLACEFGRKQVVELLLTCEMSVQLRLDSNTDILENSKTTCLHLAARNGHVDVIKLLIEFGFNINQQTPQGTCLHEAAKYGKTEVVRLLLANGIDVSRLNSYEETALEIINKFTATRAAKDLKQMLKEASSELLAQAVRDYSKPLDASHLAFKEGDIITVIDHFSKNNLWKGYCASAGGHVTHLGYFPSEAVVIIDPNNSNHDSGFSTSSSCIGHSFNPNESRDGHQNRLSGQSSESGVSGVSSHQPSSHSPVSSSSRDSLENLDDSSFSSSSVRAHETAARTDLSDFDLLSTWLRNLHLDEYFHKFVNAGYDLQTISRMTPEDLTAIGITQPSVRKKLTTEISRLTIPNGIPDFRPRSVKEWLDILHLSEYCELLVYQGYDNFDSIVGIMWEDLEEIGIQKLGHQKKIMLAIDRLKKATGASQAPLSPGILHHTSSLSPMSHQFCSESSNAVLSRNYNPPYDMKRRLNMNMSGKMVNPLLPSSVADTTFGTGFIHPVPGTNCSNLILSSSQGCPSFPTRTCNNLHSDEVIGPAPPLPVRCTVDSDLILTKQGIFPSKKEIEYKAMPHDFGLCQKSYHFTTYGTLPRRPLHKDHGIYHFQNKLADRSEAGGSPFLIKRPLDKPSLAPKCSNSTCINAHPFGIAGEKQPIYFDSSIPKFCNSSGKHRLDAFNLEGDFQIYSKRNCGHSVLSSYNGTPERSFFSTSTNETMTTNYSQQSSILATQCHENFRKETPKNCEIIRDNEEKCEQTSHLSNDSSLVSCQNLSTISLNSSDSSGTFDGSILPFASEDYGTIKERIAVLSALESMAEASNDHRDNDTVDDSRNATANGDYAVNNIKDGIVPDIDSTSHQSSMSSQANEAVFDDIDGMLLGLTQELDEMLKLRM